LLGFLALYISALNSKEMAVTLPLIVLIYEVLKCPRFGELKQFVRRNWRFAVPALIAGLLTVPYIYAKTQGSKALARLSAYRPSFSWHGFTTSNAHFVDELFYLSGSGSYHTPGVMLNGMGSCFPVCLFAAGPRAPIDGILDRNNTPSSRLYSTAWRGLPLHFAVWMGDDLCQACVELNQADL
jgi:hypothetical protein